MSSEERRPCGEKEVRIEKPSGYFFRVGKSVRFQDLPARAVEPNFDEI